MPWFDDHVESELGLERPVGRCPDQGSQGTATGFARESAARPVSAADVVRRLMNHEGQGALKKGVWLRFASVDDGGHHSKLRSKLFYGVGRRGATFLLLRAVFYSHPTRWHAGAKDSIDTRSTKSCTEHRVCDPCASGVDWKLLPNCIQKQNCYDRKHSLERVPFTIHKNV